MAQSEMTPSSTTTSTTTTCSKECEMTPSNTSNPGIVTSNPGNITPMEDDQVKLSRRMSKSLPLY